METFTTSETVQKWVARNPSLLVIFGDDFFLLAKGTEIEQNCRPL